MSTRNELVKYIRFQLSQMGAQNAHHDFEHLARHFARLRISERILPATGPVSAGGDAGRDFESYRSYLSSSAIAESTFLSKAPDGTLVFACSLNKKIESKIKSDMRVIFGSGERIDEIFYFSEADIPVAKRNKLKEYARTTYNTNLTIFDGQSLAECLSEIDLFWIATEFLDVPADIFPQSTDLDERYQQVKKRWITDAQEPISFADFAEVKHGIRKATRKKQLRADLTSWLKVMLQMLKPDATEQLQQRARYEICVAALRGLNDLSSRTNLVSDYFQNMHKFPRPSELGDAVVLLSYCSTATALGHFEMEGTLLHKYTSEVIRLIDKELQGDIGVGRQCELLKHRGMAEMLPFRTSNEFKPDPGGAFTFWKRMLRLVSNAPLFPIDSFANLLTVMAPQFADDSRFDELTETTDRLLAKRTSGHVAAEKARDRAVAYLESGNVIHAIRQLHLAKLKWFSAEALRGSLLTMLLLADCYMQLGLLYAAKYYSAVAVYLALYSSADDVKDLAAGALRQHFAISYAAGEWFTCAALASLVFGSHNNYETDNYDFERHESLGQFVYHLTILRLVAARLPPEVSKRIEVVSNEWPVSEQIKSEIDELQEHAKSVWGNSDQTELRERAQEEIWGRPFSDLGRERTLTWRALGIVWIVTFQNERDTTAVCEEFLAALQVTIADLANTDLVLLPTSVKLELYLSPQSEVVAEDKPSNEMSAWRIGLPRDWLKAERNHGEVVPATIGVASMVLGRCSTLSFESFMQLLNKSVKAGLFEKAMTVRPYTQLYLELLSAEDFDRDFRERYSPLLAADEFSVREANSLKWPTSNAPGYSEAKSKEFISNRYNQAIRSVRLSLPRIVADPSISSRLQGWKAEGRKDWEILVLIANIVVNYRLDLLKATSIQEQTKLTQELMFKEEDASAPIDLKEAFTEERIGMYERTTTAMIARTWGLQLHRQTPDFAALRRLLEVRYHITRDDVPHPDIFQWVTSEAAT